MAQVKSPMAGSVWRVLVAIGDSVAEGDELVILESMKMEIPIESPRAGTVSGIAVETAARVEEGDVLLTID